MTNPFRRRCAQPHSEPSWPSLQLGICARNTSMYQTRSARLSWTALASGSNRLEVSVVCAEKGSVFGCSKHCTGRNRHPDCGSTLWLNGSCRKVSDGLRQTRVYSSKLSKAGPLSSDVTLTTCVLHDPRSGAFETFLDDFLDSRGGRFEGKHLGRLEWFLGINVEQRSNGDYHLDQSKYIGDLLDRFIPNSKAIAFGRDIPYPEDKFKCLGEATTDAEIERVKELPYLQIIGALLYVGTMSRPDVMYHLSVLCQFMQNPSEQAMKQPNRCCCILARLVICPCDIPRGTGFPLHCKERARLLKINGVCAQVVEGQTPLVCKVTTRRDRVVSVGVIVPA